MRIIAGILLYLIIAMLIAIRIWCDDNNELDMEMNFYKAFFIANLVVLITIGIGVVLIILTKIMITGTI